MFSGACYGASIAGKTVSKDYPVVGDIMRRKLWVISPESPGWDRDLEAQFSDADSAAILVGLLAVMAFTLGAAALTGRLLGLGTASGLLGGMGTAVCGSAAAADSESGGSAAEEDRCEVGQAPVAATPCCRGACGGRGGRVT